MIFILFKNIFKRTSNKTSDSEDNFDFFLKNSEKIIQLEDKINKIQNVINILKDLGYTVKWEQYGRNIIDSLMTDIEEIKKEIKNILFEQYQKDKL